MDPKPRGTVKTAKAALHRPPQPVSYILLQNFRVAYRFLRPAPETGRATPRFPFFAFVPLPPPDPPRCADAITPETVERPSASFPANTAF